MTKRFISMLMLPICIFSVITVTYGQEIKESQNENDIIRNEYLIEELKPIQTNFKDINSIKNWTEIKTKKLNQSTEGGVAEYYFLNGALKKVLVRQFGEMGQKLQEFYLFDNRLSFVFEKTYNYNRPIYWDSLRMKQNNDNQIFDFNKSEIIEERNYFIDGKLIHQLNNQDCGSPMANDYLSEEQKKLLKQFETIKNKIKTE